ncbi:MAG: hypothetical protein PHD67_08310 [Oscillospiraceae bacterium]|nr:hypothetical protein [Oscillospiraceae bacterium]
MEEKKDGAAVPGCEQEALDSLDESSSSAAKLPPPPVPEPEKTGFFHRTRLRPFALLGLVGACFALILLCLVDGALRLDSDWNSAVVETLLENVQGNLFRLGILYHATGIARILTGVAQACVGMMCMGFALRCRALGLRWAGATAAGALFLQALAYCATGFFPQWILGIWEYGIRAMGWAFLALPAALEIFACGASLFLTVRIIFSQRNLTVSKFAAMVSIAFFALAAFNIAVPLWLSASSLISLNGRLMLQLGYLVLAISALSFQEDEKGEEFS